MTDGMRQYLEQVVMDLDFGAMNADFGWEVTQFLEAVRDEVNTRLEAQKQIKEAGEPEPVPDEPQDILTVSQAAVPIPIAKVALGKAKGK